MVKLNKVNASEYVDQLLRSWGYQDVIIDGTKVIERSWFNPIVIRVEFQAEEQPGIWVDGSFDCWINEDGEIYGEW